jgi:hypothetical protein
MPQLLVYLRPDVAHAIDEYRSATYDFDTAIVGLMTSSKDGTNTAHTPNLISTATRLTRGPSTNKRQDHTAC